MALLPSLRKLLRVHLIRQYRRNVRRMLYDRLYYARHRPITPPSLWALKREIGAMPARKSLSPVDTIHKALVDALAKTEFSAAERRRLAKEGKALPDGSFPIRNRADLRHAIHAIGRASPEKRRRVLAWIRRRARDLRAEDLLGPKTSGRERDR